MGTGRHVSGFGHWGHMGDRSEEGRRVASLCKRCDGFGYVNVSDKQPIGDNPDSSIVAEICARLLGLRDEIGEAQAARFIAGMSEMLRAQSETRHTK